MYRLVKVDGQFELVCCQDQAWSFRDKRRVRTSRIEMERSDAVIKNVVVMRLW